MMDITVPKATSRASAYREIYERYVDEAAFLWILRSVVISQPHYFPDDMAELEGRLQAQLDGLMTAPDLAWDACRLMLETGEPGEIFTAAVVAMRSHEMERIQRVVETGLAESRATPGLISALGWLPTELATPWIDKFLAGKDLRHKYLGVAACSVRRHDPAEALSYILERDDCRQFSPLYARALRLVGELRRQDLMPALLTAAQSDDEDVQFWANWSGVMLGDLSVVNRLQERIMHRGTHQEPAIQLVFRVLGVDKGREWISAMAKDKGQVRAVIKATGVLGDPHAVNWLIQRMQDPLLARLAGEAFTTITGVEIDKHQLSSELPEGQEQIPNDEINDTHVGLDEDENLPWPDAEKVAALWRRHGQHFLVGRRYFLGRPLTADWLQQKLANGSQRQRHAAALELAVSGEQPLFNTFARIGG